MKRAEQGPLHTPSRMTVKHATESKLACGLSWLYCAYDIYSVNSCLLATVSEFCIIVFFKPSMLWPCRLYSTDSKNCKPHWIT